MEALKLYEITDDFSFLKALEIAGYVINALNS